VPKARCERRVKRNPDGSVYPLKSLVKQGYVVVSFSAFTKNPPRLTGLHTFVVAVSEVRVLFDYRLGFPFHPPLECSVEESNSLSIPVAFPECGAIMRAILTAKALDFMKLKEARDELRKSSAIRENVLTATP